MKHVTHVKIYEPDDICAFVYKEPTHGYNTVHDEGEGFTWIPLTRILPTANATATDHFLWRVLLHWLTSGIIEELNIDTLNLQ